MQLCSMQPGDTRNTMCHAAEAAPELAWPAVQAGLYYHLAPADALHCLSACRQLLVYEVVHVGSKVHGTMRSLFLLSWVHTCKGKGAPLQ